LGFKNYRKAKYRALLEDPDVRRWYSNLSKGSVILADIYLRVLGRFCEYNETTPGDLAGLPVERMEDTTQDFIDRLEALRKPSGEPMYAPGYIESYLKAVRSWAEWNRKPFHRRIKISNVNRRPTLKDERAPSQEELKKVLYGDKTPLRTRACISLIAFSGVRIEVLGNYLGLDGLRIKDLPEIEIQDDGTVTFTKVPTTVVVREELSKARHRYLTFLGEEGCEVLKQYLERRIREGEAVRPESGVIATSPSQARKSRHFETEDVSPFLRTTKVGDEVRRAMRAAGLPWRPYVFRTYFDTALMLAESRGLVTHAYQQFWMGHKGDIEAQYTTNKSRLPEEVVEDMRESYRKAQALLQTAKPDAASEEKIQRSLRTQLLGLAGFTKEEIEKMDVDGVSDEELQQRIRQRFLGAMIGNGSRQKVIPTVEVERYLTQGWEFVAVLPDDRAIMKIPF
jgi:integrase